jgi:radical SAM superfamily enzyme YgiQ (UPF0313 family)
MIVIVNPNDRKMGELSAVEPPLWAGMIADRWENAVIIDANMQDLSTEDTVNLVNKFNPDAVIISVMGGNPSASSTPKMDEAIKLADSLENSFLTGLHPQAIQDGHNVFIYKPQDYMPNIPWNLMPPMLYRAHNWHCLGGLPRSPYAVIYTSLGCPFRCSYCNIHSLYGGKHRVWFREPEDVIKEVDLLVNTYGVKNIKIWDELFTLNGKHVSTICSGLRKYDLNIWAYARVDTVNQEMLYEMKAAGIKWLAYGFESGSEKVRRAVGKKYTVDDELRAIYMTRKAGINILGNFIFGLPDDDSQSMSDTLERAKNYRFEWVNFYAAMAYPGSKLYEQAVEEGVKLPETWEGYSQYSPDCLPLPTKHITGEEVLKFRDNAFREYFSDPAYLKMIEDKFGSSEEIKEMLEYKIGR